MTTDPHLEADCAWLESLKHRPDSKLLTATSAQAYNARIDRLIARAGSGQTPINVDNEPDFLGHLVEYKSPTAGTVFIPSGEPIPLSSGCIVTPVYSGPQNVTAPASPVGGDGADGLIKAWEAVNVLGAPDSACITDDERIYCRAIGDALYAIEQLAGFHRD